MACSTSHKAESAKKKPSSITPYLLKQIQGIDSISITPEGVARWGEGNNSYTIDLSHLSHRYISPKPKVLSGVETLRYANTKWAAYLNERLGDIGIRIQKVILSIPNHLVLCRVSTPVGRQRVVECLIHPKAGVRHQGIIYSKPYMFTSENMAIRELYESVQNKQILIVDYLRDRNNEGDLCIAYILQDPSRLTPKGARKYSFLGHIDHQGLIDNRSLSYQYIQQVLSPITVSLLPSCRFQDFIPRDSTEFIPKHFLTN